MQRATAAAQLLQYCMANAALAAERTVKLLQVGEIVQAIAARAGAPSWRSGVWLSVNELTPPTLQWYNKKTGKRRGSKKDRGRSARRVVGLKWLQQNMPTEYAFLCGHRIVNGSLGIPQLTVE